MITDTVYGVNMYNLFLCVKRFELSYAMDTALWKCYVLLLFSFWKRAIVSQTDIETVSKLTLGKLLRDGVEHILALPVA